MRPHLTKDKIIMKDRLPKTKKFLKSVGSAIEAYADRVAEERERNDDIEAAVKELMELYTGTNMTVTFDDED